MLTLQELKQVVSNREERRKAPSAKYLRENDVAVAKQRLMDCAEIIAYQTGYVLYCVGDYATVFPLFAALIIWNGCFITCSRDRHSRFTSATRSPS